jgi:DNA-binding NtrC family response regulator/tetratricopeptide (TPR) repeat protein
MQYAQTIAMATDLLADGRADDVVQMVEPLLDPIEDVHAAPAGQVRLHAVLARVEAVHRGNTERAYDLLAPYDAPSARAALDDPVRAEVCLWMGWALARRSARSGEEARALSLLNEALRLFRTTHAPRGRYWAELGRARAYFAVDEYSLMRRALETAASLRTRTDDVEADRWFHDLSVPALRFEGRYDEARSHVDALLAGDGDARRRGRALAHRAALDYDLGAAPEHVSETAADATKRLRRSSTGVEYPLLAAYHAHVGARLRRGDWDGAHALIEEATDAVADYPVGQAHLRTLRARLALQKGTPSEAAATLETLFEQIRHLPHGLKRSHVSLLRGQLLAAQDEPDAARTWLRRSLRNARETGHRGNQLRALLALADLAIQQGDAAAADARLDETEDYADYFGVLPYAARRQRVLGDRARLDGDDDAARGAYLQGLTAAALVGDAPLADRFRALLAAGDPAVADDAASSAPLLAAARASLAAGGRTASGDASGAPYETPGSSSDDEARRIEDTPIGAALAQAASSERLVAEAWLEAAEQVLPDRWVGVYRWSEDGSGTCVHEHGTPPASLPSPDAAASTEAEDVAWMPLARSGTGGLFMGTRLDGLDAKAWGRARSELQPWVAVARLAFEHARNSDRAPSAAADGTAPVPIDGLISESAAMQRVARSIRRIRVSHSPVLVTGERGTGKAFVARAVHRTSRRADGPWQAVRCDNMQQTSMRARLFGRAAGGEAGRGTAMDGAFQAADGGTLLLRNVEALPATLQADVLRAIQTGEVVPVGASSPDTVDVRVTATSTASLVEHVREGSFQEALFYQLNVIPLRVPPLRERRDDIPLLVQHFLDRCRPAGMPPASITDDALEALLRYDWPGNVQQLRNEIERVLAYVRSEPSPTVDRSLLSDAVHEADADADRRPALNGSVDPDQILRPDRTLNDVLARTERALIERVLRACDGQVTASADVLGLSRQGLYKKMKRLDIDASAFHPDVEASPTASS